MVNEVESILSEIRERVRAEETVRVSEVPVALENGDSPRTDSAISTQKKVSEESMARLSAHLAITGRAWDRLPPVVSNRRGVFGRLELWFKARSKSLMRWFTWEQINFNAAAHHGLSETLAALRSQEEELTLLRFELVSLNQLLAAELEKTKTRFREELSQIKWELRNEARTNHETLKRETRKSLLTAIEQSEISSRAEGKQMHESLRSETLEKLITLNQKLEELKLEILAEIAKPREAEAELRSEIMKKTALLHSEFNRRHEELLVTISARVGEMNDQLSQVANDLHDEQKVCFKQLSLETSEAAILEDRGRRALDERIKKIEETLPAKRH